MTKRLEDAWRECAHALCQARIRSDNTSGFCPTHRHMAEGVRAQHRESSLRRRGVVDTRYRSAAERMREMAGTAWAAAAADGHRMSMLMREERDPNPRPGHATEEPGYVAMCLECERYLAVDIYEEDAPFGSVVDQPCSPIVRPSLRRDEMKLESAVAHAGLERVANLEKWSRYYLEGTPCTREALDRAGW